MSSHAATLRRLDRIARALGPAAPAIADRAPWQWYADGCPCGREPGECPEHPRARPSQRPPAGDWRTWMMLMGRGAGKTRAAAEWVRAIAEAGKAPRIALVGPTAADLRDTMVNGHSGILAVSPPWNRPRYQPSRRRLTWPNGTVATCYSAEEPDRLRGPQHFAAWCDEVSSWRRPEAWENLLLGLRLGTDPRLCVTTTPRPTKLMLDLVNDPRTATTRGTTFDNKAHLAPGFFERITTRYAGSRLGEQELLGELVAISEGAWFATFETSKHVRPDADWHPDYPTHLAIDCGVSRHTAAVWFQCRPIDQRRARITVFGDFHAEGLYSQAAARAIRARSLELPHRGREHTIRLDPASSARTGIGPTARAEFAAVFTRPSPSPWPLHPVADGLDQMATLIDQGLLWIHPRCERLKAALASYRRKKNSRGEWLDEPEDPQHPNEDLVQRAQRRHPGSVPGGTQPPANAFPSRFKDHLTSSNFKDPHMNQYTAPIIPDTGLTFTQAQADGLSGMIEAIISQISPIMTPGNPTLNANGGGDSGGYLPAGTISVRITITDGFGETTPTDPVTTTINAGQIPQITFPVAIGTPSYNIYLGKDTGTEVLYARGITGTQYTLSDPIPTSSDAVPPPTTNTTGLTPAGGSNHRLDALRAASRGQLQSVYLGLAEAWTSFADGEPVAIGEALETLQRAHAAIKALDIICHELGTLIIANPGNLTTEPNASGSTTTRRSWP